MSENEKKALNDQYHSQLSEAVKSVYDLTTRLDERVQSISATMVGIERKLETVGENASTLAQRVASVEATRSDSRVEKMSETIKSIEKDVTALKDASVKSGERWKQLMQFGLQVLSAIAIAYLLYKMHLGK